MASDYLSEAEQWEAFKAWLRENGIWILGGVALGAIGLVGWNQWNAYLDRQALHASTQYQQVLEAFNKGDRTKGLSLIDELKRDHASSPYADQADLAAARVFVEAGELDKAAERLSGVMQSTDDRELALIARLRLARVQIAQDKPDDAIKTLNIPEPGAFAPRYHEVRGDAYFAKGDKVAALREYQQARETASPEVVDSRMLDLKIQDLTASGVESKEPATAAAVK